MRRLAAALLLAAALAGCASLDGAGAGPGGTAAPATSSRAGGGVGVVAEKPQYDVGDKWIRSDGVYDLVRTVGGRYVFAAANGREIWLDSDLMPSRVVKNGVTEWLFSPAPALTWPLRVGAANRSGGYVMVDGEASSGQFEWTVTAYENVRVPAGTFKAFRIELTITSFVRRIAYYSTGGGSASFSRGQDQYFRMDPVTRSVTMWYAPEVRQFVKTSGYGLGALAYEVVALDDATLNRIAIRLPSLEEAETRTGHHTYTVHGSVFAGRGLQHVSVVANDADVFDTGTRELGRDVPLEVPVKLREGRNVLRVAVRDLAGETAEHTRTIVYVPGFDPFAEKPVPLLESAPGDAPAPDTLAPPPAIVAAPPTPVPPAPAPPVTTPPPPPVVAVIPPTPAPRPAPAPAPPPPVVALPPAPRPTPAPVPAPAVVAPSPAPTPPVVASVPRPAPPAPAPIAVTPPPPALQPLTIAIAAPVDRAEVDADRLTLAGLVSGGAGVRRVVVALNGQDLTRLDDGRPQPSVPLNVDLPLREGYNTVVVTVTDASGVARQEVRTVRFQRPTPLTLDVRYPTDGARLTDASTVVAAVARSSKGIAATRVTLNGAEVADAEARPAIRRDLAAVPVAAPRPASLRRSVALTLPLTLRPGSNVIVVSVTEPDGETKQVVRTVTFDPPKAKPVVAAAPERPQPRRWAVIIGVGRYEHPGVPKLRYTVPDAQAMYDLLTGAGGFKKEEVLLLTDTTDKKPTYRNIKWALGTFLARSAGKDDTVLVFFAGHGAPEVDQRGVERDGLAKYLVPRDADPDDLYSTAVPMDELQTIFSRIEAERVVMFLDACYSGAAGGRTFLAKSTRAAGLDDAFLERLAKAKGRAIVTASRPSEVSIELGELGHGIFTYYLVQGLQGAADANRDGIVTLQEVYDYVEREVAVKSRAVGGNQHPVMKGELEGALPLVQVPVAK